MERKQFKAPDLHAPRARKKPPDLLSDPQKDPTGFFAKMKQMHPHMQQYTNKQIAGWIEEHNKLLAQEIIDNRMGIKLPFGLGRIITGICKLTDKTARQNIDYKTSKSIGVQVPYNNAHSFGYIAKVYHTAYLYRCKFKNHRLWHFKPCRKLSRAVSAVVNNGDFKKYIYFTKDFTPAKLFSKPKIKM